METNTIIKRAKILNYVEIVLTVMMYILFKISNIVVSSATSQEEIDSLLGVESFFLLVGAVVSVVVIAFTAFLMSKNHNRVKGLGLLLAAGIVTFVFSISGFMLGIVIWVLCGLSLSKLKQKKAESQFEAQLQSEMNIVNPTGNYTADNF